jgi:hypothetical protein
MHFFQQAEAQAAVKLRLRRIPYFACNLSIVIDTLIDRLVAPPRLPSLP